MPETCRVLLQNKFGLKKLDKREIGGNSGNYVESDLGRLDNEAGLYHMAPKTATGGTVDSS
jgi:hypothetical protein